MKKIFLILVLVFACILSSCDYENIDEDFLAGLGEYIGEDGVQSIVEQIQNYIEEQSSLPRCCFKWEKWIIVEEATCATRGIRTHKCLCGKSSPSSYYESSHRTETTVNDGRVIVFCFDCNQEVLNCDYVEGSKGLSINNGMVWGVGECTDSEIVIPSYYNGYAVTVIQWDAFNHGVESISSIVIPDSVVRIDDGAFRGLSNLKSIEMGDGVVSIGDDVFGWCSNLEYIKLSKNLRRIGEFCFNDCTSLKYLEVHDALTDIGDGTFYHENIGVKAYNQYKNGYYIGNPKNPYMMLVVTDRDITTLELHPDTQRIHIDDMNDPFVYGVNLQNIFVPKENEYYKSVDGVLYSKDGKTLIAYPRDKEGECFIIPDEVIEIGQKAFFGAFNLKEVILPESLVIIGDSAFKNCVLIETITLPSKVEYIGKLAFFTCYKLSSIIIPTSVKNIEFEAFGEYNNPFTIYYGGTQEEWAKILKDERWNADIGEYSIVFQGE